MHHIRQFLKADVFQTKTFYSTLPLSKKKLNELLKPLKVEELAIKPSLIIIKSKSLTGKSSNDRVFMVTRIIEKEMTEQIDINTILPEEISNTEIKKVSVRIPDHIPRDKVILIPQLHLNNAILMLNRRHAASASECLWLAASQTLKNLAIDGGRDLKSHEAKTIIVELLARSYDRYDIKDCWGVMQKFHRNSYEDKHTLPFLGGCRKNIVVLQSLTRNACQAKKCQQEAHSGRKLH